MQISVTNQLYVLVEIQIQPMELPAPFDVIRLSYPQVTGDYNNLGNQRKLLLLESLGRKRIKFPVESRGLPRCNVETLAPRRRLCLSTALRAAASLATPRLHAASSVFSLCRRRGSIKSSSVFWCFFRRRQTRSRNVDRVGKGIGVAVFLSHLQGADCTCW